MYNTATSTKAGDGALAYGEKSDVLLDVPGGASIVILPP